jgi:hypothetical protein
MPSCARCQKNKKKNLFWVFHSVKAADTAVFQRRQILIRASRTPLVPLPHKGVLAIVLIRFLELTPF